MTCQLRDPSFKRFVGFQLESSSTWVKATESKRKGEGSRHRVQKRVSASRSDSSAIRVSDCALSIIAKGRRKSTILRVASRARERQIEERVGREGGRAQVPGSRMK